MNWKSPITYLALAVIAIGAYFLFTSQWFKNMFLSDGTSTPAEGAICSSSSFGAGTIINGVCVANSSNQVNNYTPQSRMTMTGSRLPQKAILAPSFIFIATHNLSQPCNAYTVSNPYYYAGCSYVYQSIFIISGKKYCKLVKISCP